MRGRRRIDVRALCPLLLLLFGSWLADSALATETRVRSLGQGGDGFDDLSNVLRWYGSLPSYGNCAVLEWGDVASPPAGSAARREAAGRGVGAHLSLGEAARRGTLGLYLFAPQDDSRRPGERLLLYGRGWGTMQLGLLAGHTRQLTRVVSTSHETHLIAETLRLGLGARCDVGTSAYLDVAADVRGDSRRREVPAGTNESRSSWRSFAARARVFANVGEHATLVHAFAYTRDDRPEWAGTVAEVPSALTAWDWRVGTALNLYPTGDLLGLVALEYGQGRRELRLAAWEPPSEAWERRTLTARLGIEARLRPWLTLRGGARSVEELTGWGLSPDGAADAGDLDLSLGMGLHLGDLDVDLLFDDDAPFNLGSGLTNAGADEGPTFTSVSLVYSF